MEEMRALQKRIAELSELSRKARLEGPDGPCFARLRRALDDEHPLVRNRAAGELYRVAGSELAPELSAKIARVMAEEPALMQGECNSPTRDAWSASLFVD